MRLTPRVVGNAALLVLSLSLSLLLGEVIVRLIAPQQLVLIRPDIWQPADTLGWTHRPNVRTTVNTGERTIHLFTDSRGFRVAADGPVDSQKQILLLGDSFMEALQVEHEGSVAGLLEARLSQHLGQPVAVRNTAVGGWDPPHYYLQARLLFQVEKFDLVLVALYLGNDIVAWRKDRIPPRAPVKVHDLRFPRRLTWTEIVEAFLYPLNDYLEARSHLFILFRTNTEYALMRLGLTAEYFPNELLLREATSARWDITAQLCRDIAELAESTATPTLFVLLPAPVQVNPETLDRHRRAFGIDPDSVDLLQPNRLLAERLGNYRLTALDLLPVYQKANDQGVQIYGAVDGHLTPSGHKLTARAIEPAVLSLLER